LRRKVVRSQETPQQANQNRGNTFPPYLSRILSNESLSSGYNTDLYHPVETETMDTEDYELWERRRPVLISQASRKSPDVPRSKKVIRSRAQVLQSSVSDDEDDTFYESLQTPFGQPLPTSQGYQRQMHIQSPDTSCYPSDRDSTVGDYSDYDWDDVKSDIVEDVEVYEDNLKYARDGHILHRAFDGDKTPTKENEASLTMEELQMAARKLNLCLVTPTHDDENVTYVHDDEYFTLAHDDEYVPTPPKRTQKSEQPRQHSGNIDTPDLNTVSKQTDANNPSYPSHRGQWPAEDIAMGEERDVDNVEGILIEYEPEVFNSEENMNFERKEAQELIEGFKINQISMEEMKRNNTEDRDKGIKNSDAPPFVIFEPLTFKSNEQHSLKTEDDLNIIETDYLKSACEETVEGVKDETCIHIDSIDFEQISENADKVSIIPEDENKEGPGSFVSSVIKVEEDLHIIETADLKSACEETLEDVKYETCIHIDTIDLEQTGENADEVSIVSEDENKEMPGSFISCNPVIKFFPEVSVEKHSLNKPEESIDSDLKRIEAITCTEEIDTNNESTVIKPRSTKKVRAPQPPLSLTNSSSSVNLVGQSEKIAHLTPNNNRKLSNVNLDAAIDAELETPESICKDQEEMSEDEGTVLYQSPGYPLITTSKHDLKKNTPDEINQPIKEKQLQFPTASTFTYSPSIGMSRLLRKYDCVIDEEKLPELPKSLYSEYKTDKVPDSLLLLPTLQPPPEEFPDISSPISKCPHCTIHSWLPHSPGCGNKKK